MTYLRWLASLALLVSSFGASAGFESGSAMFPKVEKSVNGVIDYSSIFSDGYLVGASDAYAGWAVCAPDGVSILQERRVIYNFMEKHPELWNDSAARNVMLALQSVWPCPKK